MRIVAFPSGLCSVTRPTPGLEVLMKLQLTLTELSQPEGTRTFAVGTPVCGS